MKNKILIFFISSLFLTSEASSQWVLLRVEPSYGTFAMNDLKKFQEASIPDLGVKIESISKFPAFFGFGASILYFPNNKLGAGLTADYYNTGARNYYEDYSGSYRLDFLATSYNAGIVTDLRIGKARAVTTWFEFAGGWKISKMSISEEIIITDPVLSQNIDLESGSIWIRPGFRLDWSFLNFFSVGFLAGGELNFRSKLHLPKNPDASLRNPDGSEVKTDWTGVRLGLHVSASF